MRLDKPIGIFLLLWPALWGVWFASDGAPDKRILTIFILGVLFMRSAGCIVNDIADRKIDQYVQRTKMRPLASGKVSVWEAFGLALLLFFFAFLLVLQCNALTIRLAWIGAGLAMIYPLMKRVMPLPQFVLGVAFTWSIPMAFAAVQNQVGITAWLVFTMGALWPIIYDTMYAMVDRADDLKIGVKSTAILFNRYDKLIIGLLQCCFLCMLVIVGWWFELSFIFYVSFVCVVGLFAYQQWLIKDRNVERCFKAFLNNNWVGLIIFMGIMLSNVS
jgi:4-hydroxybenzoate polyprenyltransferase